MAASYGENMYKRPLLLTKADFLSFSLDVQKNRFCDEILINPTNSDIDDELKITLVVDMSPQPLSPSEPFIYTPIDKETGKKKHDSSIILGCNAVARIFCSHEEFFDKIKVSITPRNTSRNCLKKIIRDYRVLESIDFDSPDDRDSSFKTYGFIKGGNSNNTVEARYHSGYFSYQTDIIALLLPQSENPIARYEIEITCEEQSIKYVHAYSPQGFYPNVWHEYVSYIEELNIEPNKLSGDLYTHLQFVRYGDTKKLQAMGKSVVYTLTPLALNKEQEGIEK